MVNGQKGVEKRGFKTFMPLKLIGSPGGRKVLKPTGNVFVLVLVLMFMLVLMLMLVLVIMLVLVLMLVLVFICLCL